MIVAWAPESTKAFTSWPFTFTVLLLQIQKQWFKVVKVFNGMTLRKWPCSWCRAWWLGQNFRDWLPLQAPCCDQCSSARSPVYQWNPLWWSAIMSLIYWLSNTDSSSLVEQGTCWISLCASMSNGSAFIILRNLMSLITWLGTGKL